MKADQSRHQTTAASVAEGLAQAFDERIPLWRRIAKAVGKAWIEGSVMADPVACSYYLIAKAEAEHAVSAQPVRRVIPRAPDPEAASHEVRSAALSGAATK